MLHWVLILLLALGALLLRCTRCRQGHPGLKDLRGWAYAYGGLHDEQTPKNSAAALSAAVEAGYGLALEIHLLKNGHLAVTQGALKNAAGEDSGWVEDMAPEELARCREAGAGSCRLREVLKLCGGNVPLILELKPRNGNHGALAGAVCAMLENYTGAYCVVSPDDKCIKWMKENRPGIIRGVLTGEEPAYPEPHGRIRRALLCHQLLNGWIEPDVIACRFNRRRDGIFTSFCRRFWKAQGIGWKIENRKDYDRAVAERWLPVFEGIRPGDSGKFARIRPGKKPHRPQKREGT